MILLGNPNWRSKDGNACELNFIRDGEIFIAIHGDTIRNFHVQKDIVGADFFRITLVGTNDSSFSLLPQEGDIEFLVTTPATGRHLMAKGRIDYFNLVFDGEKAEIEIQGRSRLASLIDRRWSIEYSGELRELLQKAGDFGIQVESADLDKRQIHAYIESPSTYAAMRLLGASLGFTIEQSPDTTIITCKSLERAAEEFTSQEPITIKREELKSGNLRRGNPVKKRGVS